MKTKRILLAIVCLIVILGGLNYLLQQSPMPIGTPGSTPAAGAAQFVGKHNIKDSPYFKHPDFFGVDINSQFEKEPGVKDMAKLLQFRQGLKK